MTYRINLTPGRISETLFINDDLIKEIYDLDSDGDALSQFLDHLNSFCVDLKGRIRRNTSIVAMSDEDDENLNYVPRDRYDLDLSPWNSHSYYVTIELPNPATDFEHYKQIRTVFVNHLNHLINTFKPITDYEDD